MEAEDSGSWVWLDSPRAATIIARFEDRRLLEPFLDRERSASQAAREAGVGLATMLYRIRRFQALGLIEQTRAQARKGRAVKYYRSTAPGYRLSFAALPHEDLLALLLTLDRPVRTEALRGAAGLMQGLHGWTLQMHRDASGSVQVSMVVPESYWRPEQLAGDDYPAVMLCWLPLKLADEQAKDLQRELLELALRYAREAPATPEQSHWLGLVLAPQPQR